MKAIFRTFVNFFKGSWEALKVFARTVWEG